MQKYLATLRKQTQKIVSTIKNALQLLKGLSVRVAFFISTQKKETISKGLYYLLTDNRTTKQRKANRSNGNHFKNDVVMQATNRQQEKAFFKTCKCVGKGNGHRNKLSGLNGI